ncbi:adaptor protein MecA [Lactobacillus curvatus]|nr:adaptor protein MecA [Latilactobacillus curvatus]MSE23623.1 adaptor protein MecA [Latilactobacillus curvatus]
MRMEKIDDNTIRVLLENDDLEERGITGLDLLSNHKKIERFFYSILEEVDSEHTFANNDAVTFQVLPNDQGLELLISKNMPNFDGGKGQSEMVQGKDGITEYIKEQLLKRDTIQDDVTEEADEMTAYMNQPDNPMKQIVLSFKSFDDWVALAQQLHIESGVSNLYLYKHQYYAQIIIFMENTTEAFAKDDLAVANEYGQKSEYTAAFLNEFGEKVMDNSALELTRYYFKH